jgi:Domain of unknown function (DUF4253)
VFGIEVPNEQLVEAWQMLHAHIGETGRYPVISSRSDFEVLQEDEPDASASWMAESHACRFNAAQGSVPDRYNDTMLFDWLNSPQERPGHPLGETLRRFGASPANAEVLALRNSGVLKTDDDLERWLLRWELDRFGDRALACEQTRYLDWFHPDAYSEYVLQLVPTTAMWDAAVYSDVRMYGQPQGLATQCHDWHSRYGAELVASAITMMQVQVQLQRRPADIYEAFELALEQQHFSRDILVLTGVSVREHARALLALDRWFFHWKP